jgi:hypothetical protein
MTKEIVQGVAVPIFTLVAGKPIPGAKEIINQLKQNVFASRKNTKKFTMTNKDSELYIGTYRYIACSTTVVKQLKSIGMLQDCKEIENLISKPHQFRSYLITKKSNKNRSWLMLHIEDLGAKNDRS